MHETPAASRGIIARGDDLSCASLLTVCPFVGRGRMRRHPPFLPSPLKSERKICACAVAEVPFCAVAVFFVFRSACNFVSGLATNTSYFLGRHRFRARFRTKIELSFAGNYGFELAELWHTLHCTYTCPQHRRLCLPRFQVQNRSAFLLVSSAAALLRRKSRELSPKSVLCQSLFAPSISVLGKWHRFD